METQAFFSRAKNRNLSDGISFMPDTSEAYVKQDSNQGIGFLHFWIPSGQYLKASMGPL